MARSSFLILVAVAAATNAVNIADINKHVQTSVLNALQIISGDVAGVSHRSRRQTDPCEAAYIQELQDKVNMNDFQKFQTTCGEFLSNYSEDFEMTSICKNKCLAPLLDLFTTLGSIPAPAGCSSDVNADTFKFAKAFFTDVTCAKNKKGETCGSVISNSSSWSTKDTCEVLEEVGCCYNAIFSTLNEYANAGNETGFNVTDPISESDKQAYKDNCTANGGNYPQVFAEKCTPASKANGGIAESDISSGTSSSASLLVPTASVVVLPILMALYSLI